MRRFKLLLAAGLLSLLLGGCFSQSVDELYRAPRAPDDYLKLDERINEVLNAGGEYAAPLTGELTQKVQLQDLDGDGVQEAIAFFRVSADERPLKIYIYRQVEEDYEVAAIIEGSGNAINSVSYENLDNSPTKSLIEIGARVEQATHLKWATREDWDRFTRIMQYGIRLSDGTEHTIGDIIRITDEHLTAPVPAEPVPAPTGIDMPQFPSPRFTSSQPAYLQD